VRYDPETPPDPDRWLGCDEAERLDAILRYHQKIRFKAGSLKIHAVLHAAIENQLAEGLRAVCDALERLRREGLDRHEALHAVGSVFVEQLPVVRTDWQRFDQEEYERGLRELTVSSWRALAEE